MQRRILRYCWRCDTPSNGEIRTTVLALATAAERVDRMDLVWLEENLLRCQNMCIIQRDGRTPLVSIRKKHVNLERLDLNRLSKVAELLSQSFDQNFYRRFTRSEVLKIIVDAVQQDLILPNQLQPKVKSEVVKVISS